MDDLKISESFNWEMTREVSLNIGMDIPSVTYQYNKVIVTLDAVSYTHLTLPTKRIV